MRSITFQIKYYAQYVLFVFAGSCFVTSVFLICVFLICDVFPVFILDRTSGFARFTLGLLEILMHVPL